MLLVTDGAYSVKCAASLVALLLLCKVDFFHADIAHLASLVYALLFPFASVCEQAYLHVKLKEFHAESGLSWYV